MKIDKKNYPQVYLEQCKYKIKKKKVIDFIDAELDLDSDDSDDSNSEYYIMHFRLTKIMHDITYTIRSLIKIKLCYLSTVKSSIKHNIFYVLKCDTNISLK